jgi:hypothetical protein
MTAVAINLYGVACALTRRAAIFGAFSCGTATGRVLTDFRILIICHDSSSNEFELPVVWRSTLSHSTARLEAVPRT